MRRLQLSDEDWNNFVKTQRQQFQHGELKWYVADALKTHSYNATTSSGPRHRISTISKQAIALVMVQFINQAIRWAQFNCPSSYWSQTDFFEMQRPLESSGATLQRFRLRKFWVLNRCFQTLRLSNWPYHRQVWIERTYHAGREYRDLEGLK